MNRFSVITISLLAVGILSGCGNTMGAMPQRAGKSSGTGTGKMTASSAEVSSDSEWSCPNESEPDVRPDYDWDLNGSGYYRVCSHRETPSNFKIHGRTNKSDTICIFPAKTLGTQTKVWRDQMGLSYSQCVQATSQGAFVSLPPEMEPNAFFIVEGPDDERMHLCLESGAYTMCPHFSFGKLSGSRQPASE